MSKSDQEKEKEKLEKKLSSTLAAASSAKAWSDLLPITREIYQLLSKTTDSVNFSKLFLSSSVDHKQFFRSKGVDFSLLFIYADDFSSLLPEYIFYHICKKVCHFHKLIFIKSSCVEERYSYTTFRIEVTALIQSSQI